MAREQQVELTGAALRAEREVAGASQGQVARAWPCSTTNVQLIEGSARLTEARRIRYREALARASGTAPSVDDAVAGYVAIGERLRNLVEADA